MNKRKVLVVEDDVNTLKMIRMILLKRGYQVLSAGTGEEALALYEEHRDIDVVLSDLKMPGMSGGELFQTLGRGRPTPPFVIMTAYGTVRSAVEALKQGVADYLIKPLDYDELGIVLEKAVNQWEMSRELDRLRDGLDNGHSFHNIVGSSPSMRRVFELIRTVGPTDAPVMIYGETGTGKELVAQALHRESPRKRADMVSINCAALARDLLESELFGHVKGAFTGASNHKTGRLQLAHKSTLFLDEIGHMSLKLQSKLLRFAQEMTYESVGSSETKQVDVRLIGATNLDLRLEIEQGRFLQDLLYRLEVIAIHIPPLRQRIEDIPLLVEPLLKRYAGQYDRQIQGISREALEMLCNYSWPGNVRELQNYLARAVILAQGPELTLGDFPIISQQDGEMPASQTGDALIRALPEQGASIQTMEAELICKTLAKCRGNKSRAAKMLGITRKGLYKKIARHGLG